MSLNNIFVCGSRSQEELAVCACSAAISVSSFWIWITQSSHHRIRPSYPNFVLMTHVAVASENMWRLGSRFSVRFFDDHNNHHHSHIIFIFDGIH
jgi:hypothetical protein